MKKQNNEDLTPSTQSQLDNETDGFVGISNPVLVDTESQASVGSSGGGNNKPAASNEPAAENQYRKLKKAPLRFQALPPLFKIENLTLSGYDALSERIKHDASYQNLPAAGSNSKAELIIRACHLLFALVESGGLLNGLPEKAILTLKINPREAGFGFLQPIAAGSQEISVEREFDNSETESPDNSQLYSRGYSFRRALYAYGRLHLAAFIKYRISIEKADFGDPLLPPLKITEQDYISLCSELPWLREIKYKHLNWKKIFRAWLRSKTQDDFPQASWSNVAQISAWRLCERERHPFLIAARRELFRSPAIPAAKFNEILKFGDYSFESAKKSPTVDYDPGKQIIDLDDAERQDFEAEIADTSVVENPQKLSNFAYAARLLAGLRNYSEKESKKLAEEILRESKSEQLKGTSEVDLRSFLRWTAAVLNSNGISTAHTYAVKVLRALYSMPHIQFAVWSTQDAAEYLENYSTHASVSNVRSALKRFDAFLIDENSAAKDHIKWNSHSLHAPVTYAARDVISNKEYELIRTFSKDNSEDTESAVCRRDLAALTLLRRCGLRVGESVHLTSQNFTGYSKWCLNIWISKTRAGIRRLPLFLLLSESEQTELRKFIDAHEKSYGKEAFLFIGEESGSVPLTPAALGRRIEFLISGAAIIGETAHGLRHGFASALFASFG